jgi:beta-glucosidase
MRASLLVLAAAACLGCGTETSPPLDIIEVTFPEGFVWGTATAAFQVEKGLGATDWGVFATIPDNIAGGDLPDDGPDAFAHVDDDIERMAALGATGYRMGIEMARIYPTRADYDADTPSAEGLALYDGYLQKLKAAGIRPMVTLHHFVWPSYMSDPTKPAEPQGFERDDAVAVLAGYCEKIGARYGADVDLWITINEPTVEAAVGYLAAIWPPGVSDVERMTGVLKKQVEAHARCYDKLHAADTVDADGDGVKVAVSIAKHNRVYEPADPSSDEDRASAEHSRRFWNQWFMDAIVKGDVDETFDDTLGDGDRVADPTLKGRADFFGLNYYGASIVGSKTLQLPYMGSQPNQLNVPNGRPKNDLRWDMYPAGFGIVLDEAWGYGLPIYVTENGTADATDNNRPRFLLEHAFEMGKAYRRGVDVRGYFHWSLIDNFEWASGYCPQFGLYRVDFSSPEKPRTASAAAAAFTTLATSNHVSQDEIDATPPYVSLAKDCGGL